LDNLKPVFATHPESINSHIGSSYLLVVTSYTAVYICTDQIEYDYD